MQAGLYVVLPALGQGRLFLFDVTVQQRFSSLHVLKFCSLSKISVFRVANPILKFLGSRAGYSIAARCYDTAVIIRQGLDSENFST